MMVVRPQGISSGPGPGSFVAQPGSQAAGRSQKSFNTPSLRSTSAESQPLSQASGPRREAADRERASTVGWGAQWLSADGFRWLPMASEIR